MHDGVEKKDGSHLVSKVYILLLEADTNRANKIIEGWTTTYDGINNCCQKRDLWWK